MRAFARLSPGLSDRNASCLDVARGLPGHGENAGSGSERMM